MSYRHTEYNDYSYENNRTINKRGRMARLALGAAAATATVAVAIGGGMKIHEHNVEESTRNNEAIEKIITPEMQNIGTKMLNASESKDGPGDIEVSKTPDGHHVKFERSVTDTAGVKRSVTVVMGEKGNLPNAADTVYVGVNYYDKANSYTRGVEMARRDGAEFVDTTEDSYNGKDAFAEVYRVRSGDGMAGQHTTAELYDYDDKSPYASIEGTAQAAADFAATAYDDAMLVGAGH